MRSRKFVVLILCVAMVCTGGTVAFATELPDAATQSQDETALAVGDDAEVAEEANAIVEEAEEEAVLETASDRVEGNITVHYPPSLSEETDTTVTAYYTDDFFSSDNSVYNKKLAKFTLATAMASFAYSTTEMSLRDKNIKQLLTVDLKFSGYKSFKYDVKLDNSDDTAGYAFAYKELENGERVMAVVIRSYGYGSEWASNLRLTGGGDEHKGFAATADAVYKDVKTYVQANDITKIWIAGYSRGAAVANVLGKRVADNKLVDADDMYCYTFETPTTTKKGTAVQGLYNVINSSDFVAQIPMYLWGYGRYGQDEFYVINKASIKNYKKGMASSNVKNLKKKIDNYAVPTVWSNEKLIKCASGILGGNETNFASKYEATLRTLVDKYFGGESQLLNRSTNNGEKLDDALDYVGLEDYFDSNNIDLYTTLKQHTPEVLLAWMDVINASETNTYKYITVSSKSYKNINISVTDSKGKKVAEITGGNYKKFIKKNPIYSLEVNKDSCGDLQILVPTDDKYTFKLTAKSAVTVDYKVTDYSYGAVTRISDYKNIKLSKKGTVTAKGASKYAPKITKGKIGSKAVYDSTQANAVEVQTEVNGGLCLFGINANIVEGAGRYPDGYPVKLSVCIANPNKYYCDSWTLDGVKVGSGNTCTITTDASKENKIVVEIKQKS